MFAAFGDLAGAEQAFMKLSGPNVYSWSALISLHADFGRDDQALELYEEMRFSTVKPDGHVYVSVLKACSKLAALDQGKIVHGHIVEDGLGSDIHVGSALIGMYSECGSISNSCMVFQRLPVRNVVTWSTLITGYAQQGHSREALQAFHLMQEEGTKPDLVTFICILKVCSNLVDLVKAYDIHAHILERGFETDAIISNALVSLYARCGDLHSACCMFDRSREQGVVACSALIAGLTQCNQGEKALQLFDKMHRDCLLPDVVTFICTLKACSSIGALEYGRYIHACLIGCGVETDLGVGTTLIDMYAKCESFIDAHVVLNKLPKQNIVAWNAFIVGFNLHACSEVTVELYDQLQYVDICPDQVTFTATLKACSSSISLSTGMQVHSHVVERGLEQEELICNALVDMYAKCGNLLDAHAIFDTLPNRDVVTWSSLIGGYSQQEHIQEALDLFKEMQKEGIEPDPVAFTCVLKARFSPDYLDKGRQLHAQIILTGWEADSFLGSSLINMYASLGSLEDMCILFDKLQIRTLMAWNALIASYSLHDHNQEALKIFKKMREECVQANPVTFVYILKACADVSALHQGRQVHSYIINSGCTANVVIASTLIDMYVKCGSLEDAKTVFESVPERNVVIWSALIAGYAQHNDYHMAFLSFESMQQAGLKPDNVAFLSLISACSRAGLTEKGFLHFKSMRDEYGISPKLEHYNSILELLCQGRDMDKAEDLLESIPCRANIVGWTSLLSCCRRHLSVNLGRRCFDHLTIMKCENAVVFVLMSSIYTQAGMWEHAEKIEALRKCLNGWKKPARAFIEVDNKVHDFIVGDKIHPSSVDIYAKMKSFSMQLKL